MATIQTMAMLLKTISHSAGLLLIIAALLAVGLAYGHSRLSLAAAYSSERDYDLAALHLQASGWLAGYDSRWHYSQARVLMAAAESGSTGRQDLIAKAQTHLQAALDLSPLWSDPWTWLAIARLQQAKTDDTFDLAFARSASLGPNETRNLVALFPWALLHWSDLSGPQQGELLVRADRAARRIPDWVVSTASRYGQLYTVCDRLETRVWAQKQCQSGGWTPATKTES